MTGTAIEGPLPHATLSRSSQATRLRVGGWYVLLFVAALVVAMVPLQRMVLRGADDTVTVAMQDQVDGLRDFVAAADGARAQELLAAYIDQAGSREGEFLIGLVDGRVLATNATTSAQLLATDRQRARWAALDGAQWGSTGERRWLHVPVGADAALVVAADVGAERRQARGQIATLVLIAAAALMVGGVLAWMRVAVAGRPAPRLALPAGDPARLRAPALDDRTVCDGEDSVSDGEDTVSEEPDPRPAPAEIVRHLVAATELTDDLFAVLWERNDGRLWHVRNAAGGDLVADPHLLSGVVVAMAEEAMVGTHPGDQLVFASGNHDGGIRFSVIGSGPPPPDIEAPLADPVARAVIAAHDGRIWREHTPGSNMVWSLFVPRRPHDGPVLGPAIRPPIWRR